MSTTTVRVSKTTAHKLSRLPRLSKVSTVRRLDALVEGWQLLTPEQQGEALVAAIDPAPTTRRGRAA